MEQALTTRGVTVSTIGSIFKKENRTIFYWMNGYTFYLNALLLYFLAAIAISLRNRSMHWENINWTLVSSQNRPLTCPISERFQDRIIITS